MAKESKRKRITVNNNQDEHAGALVHGESNAGCCGNPMYDALRSGVNIYCTLEPAEREAIVAEFGQLQVYENYLNDIEKAKQNPSVVVIRPVLERAAQIEDRLAKLKSALDEAVISLPEADRELASRAVVSSLALGEKPDFWTGSAMLLRDCSELAILFAAASLIPGREKAIRMFDREGED